MSDRKTIHVILVPGADALEFGPDVAEAERRHIAAHALILPAYSGHPIDGRRPYYDAVSRQIQQVMEAIREKDSGARIFGVGRNQGASLLGHAAADNEAFCGLVFTGAIPELSLFRANSVLPSARAFRDSLSDPEELSRIPEMRDMDLTQTLQRIEPDRCLLQIGTRDDWIDEASVEAYRHLETTFRVDWIDDDHAMNSPASIGGRWDFVERLAAAADRSD